MRLRLDRLVPSIVLALALVAGCEDSSTVERSQRHRTSGIFNDFAWTL